MGGFYSILLITNGIGNEEKKCTYYEQSINEGNGMLICNKNKLEDKQLKSFQKKSEVIVTKLSNYIPYISDKNIALIKLDIEGGEEEAIKSGIELVTKYHVPFIFIEFSPIFLKEHGTVPKQFVQLMVDSGYYINTKSFLDKNYLSIEEFLEQAKIQINTYFIYKDAI